MLVSASSVAAGKIVVGYYYPGATPSYTFTGIRYDCLTHIAHAFVLANQTGALDVPGGYLYPQLNQRAHEKNVKVVVSVGGWGNDVPFAKMAADTAARHRFVQNLKNFCTTNSYDGADLDWEYPTTADKANFTALVHELRLAFNTVTPALTLSAAFSAGGASGYDLAAVIGDFDWVGIMTYDFYGTWTPKAGPNSPLYGTYVTTDQGWIDNSVSYYAGKNVPMSKLLIGIPFYGWSFKTSSLYGAQSSGAAQLQYTAIAPKLQQGWTRTWDAPTHTPYLTDAAKTTVISYDDSASVYDKCEYIKSKNVGGAIIWAIGQDYSAQRQPLLEVIGQRLYNVTAVNAEPGAVLPARYELQQNYPNPFNPSTHIQFVLGDRNYTTLTVYNMLGERVSTLLQREMQPGTYSLEWNAGSLPSGVYFYRLTAGAYSSVKSMVLQK